MHIIYNKYKCIKAEIVLKSGKVKYYVCKYSIRIKDNQLFLDQISKRSCDAWSRRLCTIYTSSFWSDFREIFLVHARNRKKKQKIFPAYRHGTCPVADTFGAGSTDTGSGWRGLPRSSCCADTGSWPRTIATAGRIPCSLHTWLHRSGHHWTCHRTPCTVWSRSEL